MADNWSLFLGWQKVLPPSRPAKWQLDIIRNLLSGKHCINVAVLGSTIEFRDVLSEFSVDNIYVFDDNIEFHKYISQFRTHKNKEQLIIGNWLNTLENFDSHFDLILSDLTSGNISYENREQFYKLIANALTINGCFVDRVLTYPLSFIPINTLIEKYKNLPINQVTVNSFNCEVIFCSTLLNNKKNIVDTNAFYDYLCSLNIPQITSFVHACYDITPRDCIWYYSIDWKIERQIYEKKLSIIETYEEPINSAYYKRAKLLISKKKDCN